MQETVYLSGPMAGRKDFNYPAFRSAAKKLRDMGYTVLDPSENFEGARERPTDRGFVPIPRAEYIRQDVQNVLQADRIVVLAGWEQSAGARLEVRLGVELGLTVTDFETWQPADLGILDTGGKGDPRFHALLQHIGDLHDKKQQDYGSNEDPFANVRSSQDWGIPAWVGAFIRLNDKVYRLKQFAKKGKLANEGAEDSMMDIAVYALIALILYREESSDRSAETDKPTADVSKGG
jgi:hypothetical protein